MRSTWPATLVASLAAIGWLHPQPADACSSPPPHLIAPHPDIVRRTARIALGRFERAGATLDFTTVEVIKGQVGARFSLPLAQGHPTGFKDQKDADFHGHTDWEFWEQRATREGNGADCLMHPRFQVGATYLIFLDRPYHWRAFERIDRPDDRWLAGVKALVAKPDRGSGLLQTLAAHVGEQYAVFLAEVIGCHVSPTYSHQLKVREVLAGDRRDVLSLFHGGDRCVVGTMVLALVHRSAQQGTPTDHAPPGRIIPFHDAGGRPVWAPTESMWVDFNAGGSEAVITDLPRATLAQLRSALKPPSAAPPRPTSRRRDR